ncbi:MAG: metal-dependent hydrolase [Gemmatimonadota bacterium]
MAPLDNVSHSLAGWALARAAARARPAGTTLCLILANNLPDVDILLSLRSDAAYLLYHRGITHSLLGWAVLPLVLALGLWWGYARRTSFGWFCLLAYTGVGLHLLYDLVTPWGMLLLYPFALTRFAYDWLFIVDLVTWTAPAVAVLVAWRRPARSRAAVAGFLLFLLAYGAAAGALHADARRAVERAETGAGRTVAEAYAFPLPFAPWRWYGVAIAPPDVPEPTISHYRVGGVPARSGLTHRTDRGFAEPWAARAIRSPAGQEYLWWAPVPVAETRIAGDVATVFLQDLRFGSVDPSGAAPFGLRFRFDRTSGKLLDQRWLSRFEE